MKLVEGHLLMMDLLLAQAMIEYVAQTSHAKTLFSTHYHELTSLDQMLPCLKMYM